MAREQYGLAGAVQHGASTLSAEAFDAFPRVGACEIHLATNFQNMVYDHPAFPAALKDEMYAWVREHAQEEKKPKDTDEQFLYKARKKAIGPFKGQLWGLPPEVRATIGATLEDQFAFLMSKLRIPGTSGGGGEVRHAGHGAAVARERPTGRGRQDHLGRAQGGRPGRLIRGGTMAARRRSPRGGRRPPRPATAGLFA